MAIIFWSLVLAGCHSPAQMTPFEAASGKPLTVTTPVVFPAPGYSSTSVTGIALSCATAGAVIHYTYDGEAPSSGINPSTFTFNKNTNLTAWATKEGFPDSSSVTFSYQIGVAPIEVYYHNNLTNSDSLLPNTSMVTVGQAGYLWLKATAASLDTSTTTPKNSVATTIYYNYKTDLVTPVSTAVSDCAQWTQGDTTALVLADGKTIHLKAFGAKGGMNDSIITERTVYAHFVGGVGTSVTGPVVVSILPSRNPDYTNPNRFIRNSTDMDSTDEMVFTVNVTLAGTPVTAGIAYQWLVNGVDPSLLASGSTTGSSLTLDLPAGYFNLTCVVTYQGYNYSPDTSYTFWMVN